MKLQKALTNQYIRIFLIWLAHKVTFLITTGVAVYVGRPWWETVYQWDGSWYLDLATHGYWFNNIHTQSTIAFPPIFSLLGHALSLIGIPIKIGLLVISWISSLGSMYLLFNIVNRHYDTQFAEKVILITLFNPLGLVWSLPYTEALFLLILLIFWNLWEQHKVIVSGIALSLLPIIRIPGFIFGLLFLAGYIKKDKQRWKYLVGGLIANVGMIGWFTYMHIFWGNWNLPLLHQTAWLRSFYLYPGILTLQAEHLIKHFILNTHSWFHIFSLSITLFPYIIDWFLILFISSLLFLKWKNLPKNWGWLSLIYTIYVLSFPSFTVEHMIFIPSLGAIRYLIVCFPIAVLIVKTYQHHFNQIFRGLFILHLLYLSYFMVGMYIP